MTCERACPTCGNLNAIESMERWHYKECGLNHIYVNLPVLRCACGEIAPTIYAMARLHDSILWALMRQYGVQDEKLTFVRKSMGQSQRELTEACRLWRGKFSDGKWTFTLHSSIRIKSCELTALQAQTPSSS